MMHTTVSSYSGLTDSHYESIFLTVSCSFIRFLDRAYKIMASLSQPRSVLSPLSTVSFEALLLRSIAECFVFVLLLLPWLHRCLLDLRLRITLTMYCEP